MRQVDLRDRSKNMTLIGEPGTAIVRRAILEWSPALSLTATSDAMSADAFSWAKLAHESTAEQVVVASGEVAPQKPASGTA